MQGTANRAHERGFQVGARSARSRRFALFVFYYYVPNTIKYTLKFSTHYVIFNLKYVNLKAQHQNFGGKCGICGDPYEGYKPHEVPGKYAMGIIGRSYFQPGQVSSH